jgi:capsule polysaccharide modification protein KpsS
MTKTICFFPIVRYQAELFCNLAKALLRSGIAGKVLFICPSVSSYEYVKSKFPCFLTADLLTQAKVSKRLQHLNDETDLRYDLFELRKLKVEDKYHSNRRKLSANRIQQEAHVYLQIWDSFLEKHGIDILYIWNGYIVPQETLVIRAKQKGLQVLFFENGYEPNTFVMDPKGINAKSNLKITLSEMGQAITSNGTKTERSSVRTRVIDYIALRLKIKLYQFKYHKANLLRYEFSQSFCTKLLHMTERLFHIRKFEPREPYIFFPLQVITDSQLIENYDHEQAETVKQIALLLHQINTERTKPIQLIVKEHPRQETHRYMKQLMKQVRYPDVVFTRYADTNQLIKNAAAVITINSSVGYQALKMEKSVFVLGDSIYDGPGLGEKVKDLNLLMKKILQIIEENLSITDTNKVDEFVQNYRKVCYPLQFTNHTSEEIIRYLIKLSKIGELS